MLVQQAWWLIHAALSELCNLRREGSLLLRPMEDQRLFGAKIEDPGLETLLDKVWGLDPTRENKYDFDSVVVALEAKLSVFDEQRHILRKFSHLYSLIDVIKTHWNSPRCDLLLPARDLCDDDPMAGFPFQASAVQDHQVNNSIDLAIEIWLMIRLQVERGNGRHAGEAIYEWNVGDSFDTGLMRCFDDPRPQTYDICLNDGHGNNPGRFTGTITKMDDPSQPSKDSIFSSLFTLADMERLGSFNIAFTNNLLHHLYLDKFRERSFRPTVFIFSHATVLSRLRDKDLRHHRELLQEALNTLGLLIPFDDSHSQEWFKNIVENSREGEGPFAVDQNAGSQPAPSRRVCDYHYWRPRLLLLEEEFKNSSPRTIKGWWRDRRDRKVHATLWAAFAAVLFAILALVVAILSAVYGAKSFEEARLANRNAIKSKAESGNSSDSVSTERGLLPTTPMFTFLGCCCYPNSTNGTAVLPPAILTRDSSTFQSSSVEPEAATTTSKLYIESLCRSPESSLYMVLEPDSSTAKDDLTPNGTGLPTIEGSTQAPTETRC
ncbi:hypothetical protein FALBO_4134 [Fusarium albosuccineum]|uniref:Uncharacterized protein n=1 Tax=Fusarium albosuccineum TaxID=1237068 RepID=A0A8H4PFC8_9HYPO|nr:hypothetical protein FALBO_4134 [Fusarium albosuccineum]